MGQDIGADFSGFFRDSNPKRQEKRGDNKEDAEDGITGILPDPQPVLEVIEEDGGDDVNRHPGGEVGEEREDEGTVAQNQPDAPAKGDLLLTGELFFFCSPKGSQREQGDENPQT